MASFSQPGHKSMNNSRGKFREPYTWIVDGGGIVSRILSGAAIAGNVLKLLPPPQIHILLINSWAVGLLFLSPCSGGADFKNFLLHQLVSSLKPLAFVLVVRFLSRNPFSPWSEK